MKKMLLIISFLSFIIGCDIDFVTDTVYIPVFYEIPAYYVDPYYCCYDYVEVYY